MTPDYLKIENFLSHDQSEVDFKKFDLALILGSFDGETDQSNGSGKTAIMAAILWALFGKSRHKKKDGVVKWDKRSCRVEFSFWMNNDLYRITRTRDKIVGESDVVFEKWNGSQYDSISCDTNSATDNKIEETININYEVFINSIYFKQNDISMFATSAPGKRKDILKALLKMSKWDQYQKKSKDRAKILSTKIEEKSKLLIPFDGLQLALNTCVSDIENLEVLLAKNTKEYDENNSKFVGLSSQYHTLYSDSVDDNEVKLSKLQKEYSVAVSRKNKLSADIIENNTSISNSNDSVASIKQRASVLREKVKAKKDINLQFLRSKLIEGKSKDASMSDKILELNKDVELSGECDLCGKQITKSEADAIKESRIQKLSDLKQKQSEIKSKISKLSKLLKEQEKIVEDGNSAELEISKLETKISKLQSDINNKITENERISIELSKIDEKKFEREIDLLKIKADANGRKLLKKEIDDLELLLKSTKLSGSNLSKEYGHKLGKKEEFVASISAQKEIQSQIERLKSEFIIYDKLKSYFGKDGIQSIIIENVIGELENYTNETLEKICNEPTSISIKTQRQNENGSWAETIEISTKVGQRTDDFESLCGGEQFRISLAIRLALSSILSSRMGGKIKFLLLDEVSSSLDNKGLRMFMDTIKGLSNEMKVLVITHDDRLKDMFEHVIMVDKGPSGSRVTMS